MHSDSGSHICYKLNNWGASPPVRIAALLDFCNIYIFIEKQISCCKRITSGVAWERQNDVVDFERRNDGWYNLTPIDPTSKKN